jgi:hypothetical protein
VFSGVGVSIEQGASQIDPTGVSPIVFDVVLTDDVADFETGDVTITSTSGEALTGVVSGSGKTYTVTVPVTMSGLITATVAAGVASAGGLPNVRSESVDNQVNFSAVEIKVDALSTDVAAIEVKLDDEARCKKHLYGGALLIDCLLCVEQ